MRAKIICEKRKEERAKGIQRKEVMGKEKQEGESRRGEGQTGGRREKQHRLPNPSQALKGSGSAENQDKCYKVTGNN